MRNRDSSTSDDSGARVELRTRAWLAGCLLLVACDRGMDVTGVSGGNVSDPVTVELRGLEPAMFECCHKLWDSS